MFASVRRIARALVPVALTIATPAFGQAVAVRDLPKPTKEIEDPFSLVGGVLEYKPGQLLAIDPTESQVVLVDFAKGTRSPIGRQGSGPGEYRAPAAILRMQGDSIWLIDGALQRVTVFNPDLTPGTTFPMLVFDQSTMTAITAPYASDKKGNLYGSALKISGGVGGASGQDMQMTFPDSVGLLRFDPRKSTRTEITKLKFPVSGKPEISRAGNAMKYSMAYPGLVAADSWAVLPDGRIIIVRGATYSVEFLNADGSRKAAGQVAYTPIRVTAADQKAEMDEARRVMQEQGKVAQKMMPAGFTMEFELLPPASWPANYPAISPLGIFAAPDGRVWVRRSIPFRVGREQWDVLDANGKHIASWRFPPKTTLNAVGSDGVIYTTRTDEDDLRYLQRIHVGK